MIDLNTWGGAQWVLSFWLLLNLSLFPAIGVVVAAKKRAAAAWIGWYLGRFTRVAVLFAVLAWGGFWA